MNQKINYNSKDLKDHLAIGAVIKNDRGEILMQKHIKYGFWTIPIGKAEPNQTVIDALKQEVFEECNLVVEKFKEIGSRIDVYNREGHDVEVRLHLFEVEEYSGKLYNKEPNKHSEQKFISFDKICKLEFVSDNVLLFLKLNGVDREARIE